MQAGHLLCSPFLVVLGKAIALEEEGKMWGKGRCRNDCGFWLDPGGVVLGTAPLIDFSGETKAVSHPQELFGLSLV